MITLHIVPDVTPDLTWGGRLYALIENMITAPNMRLGRK
jgi:hypothetical protein